MLLPLRNGSWIAIYYDDSHMFFTWSQAVALDSDGNWYESQVHYCGSLPIAGNLEILRKVVENASEPQQPDDSGYRNFHLLTIREAANLAVACEHLLAIGFQPVDESTRPRLRGPVAVDK